MICSDDEGRPVGFCLISTPQVRMNKNTLLNQNYICPMGADTVQALKNKRDGVLPKSACAGIEPSF